MTVTGKVRNLLTAFTPALLKPKANTTKETVVRTAIERTGLASTLDRAYLELSRGKGSWTSVLGDTLAAKTLADRGATVVLKGSTWCVHVNATNEGEAGDILVKFASDIGSRGPECKVVVRTVAHGDISELAHQLSACMAQHFKL